MANFFRSCYKCTERHLGCHSVCEKYISEKQQHDAAVKRDRETYVPPVRKGSFLGDSDLSGYAKKKRRGR